MVWIEDAIRFTVTFGERTEDTLRRTAYWLGGSLLHHRTLRSQHRERRRLRDLLRQCSSRAELVVLV